MSDLGPMQAPMPTEKEAWLAKCAQRYIDRALLEPELAFELAEVCYEQEPECDPVEAADNDMDCWDNDE